MMSNMEAPNQIDLDLLYAIENNSLHVVSDLIKRGANPYVLIPVEHSQFKSSFQNGPYTHFSCFFRALSIYRDDAVVSLMLTTKKRTPSLPTAYVTRNGKSVGYPGLQMSDGQALPTRCDLLSAMVEMRHLSASIRQRIASVLYYMSASSDEGLTEPGKVAAQYLRQFCNSQAPGSLEKALILLELGADLGSKADRQELLKESFRVAIDKNELSVSLPVAIILGASDDVAANALTVLMKHGDLDKDFRCNGMTLLQWCACVDRHDVIEVLLSAGANPEAKTESFSYDDGRETAQSVFCFPPSMDALKIATHRDAADAVRRLRAFGARSSMQAVMHAARARHAAKAANDGKYPNDSSVATGDAHSGAELFSINAPAVHDANSARAA